MLNQTYFYCYSYKLKNFLKLQGINYLYQARHKNGNRYWAYHSTVDLNRSLTLWNDYKIFINKKEGSE